MIRIVINLVKKLLSGLNIFWGSILRIRYGPIDSVSMGSCLGPLLANIIITKLEASIVDNLFKDNLLKFYIRCVDGIWASIK